MLCAAGGPGGPCSFGMPAAKQRFAINDLIRTILLYKSVQYRVRMKINAKLGWFTKQHAGPNPVSAGIEEDFNSRPIFNQFQGQGQDFKF